MKNPLNHEAILSHGRKGLGSEPSETLSVYLYYLESKVRPQLQILDTSLPIHDRLLETTLLIFDAALDDKNVMKIIYDDLLTAPCLVKTIISNACDLFSRIFNQIGLPADDLESKTRLNVYVFYFSRWLSTWFDDTTPDQSLILAVVDRDLNQLKNWKEWVKKTISF